MQELIVLVSSGIMPDLKYLPVSTPFGLDELLKNLWCTRREDRLTAFECFATLSYSTMALESPSFDIFFSHAWSNKKFLAHVYHYLCCSGYKVWYDQNEMGYNLDHSMLTGIRNSKIVVVCLSRIYQERANCLKELEWAAKEGKPVVILLLESGIQSWISEPVLKACSLSNMYVDLSESFTRWSVSPESELIAWEITKLRADLAKVFPLLFELGCSPSLHYIPMPRNSANN
jgi:hypothetical protein